MAEPEAVAEPAAEVRTDHLLPRPPLGLPPAASALLPASPIFPQAAAPEGPVPAGAAPVPGPVPPSAPAPAAALDPGFLVADLRKRMEGADKAERLRLVKSAAAVDHPEGERLLWDALADPCEQVRDFVMRALSARPSIRLKWAAERLAVDPWFVRSSAARILGQRKDPAAVKLLEPFPGDRNADARRAAAEALGEIGGDEALQVLVKLRRDKSPIVKREAEKAIEKISPIRFS